MDNNESPVGTLTEDQCWNLLAGTEVGRLATALDGRPEIFPLNYVVDGESLVFRTAEGSKLLEMTLNDQVALEIDGWTEESGWSVVVAGTAGEVTDPTEHALVEHLPLRPWVPTVKVHYIRITPTKVSGRTFVFGEEPQPPSA